MIISNSYVSVHETFQQTVQGEGHWTGVLVDFIRLYGCPVGCHWCDTGYSDGGLKIHKQVRSIRSLIQELRSPRVVVSGGEPFIHKILPELLSSIIVTGRQVSIETSGAIWRDIPECWITLSPKQHISPKYQVQPQFWKRANEIKIIISTGKELKFYENELSQKTSIPIYLQPEWNEKKRTIPLTLSLIKQYPRFKLSIQAHKYLNLP